MASESLHSSHDGYEVNAHVATFVNDMVILRQDVVQRHDNNTRQLILLKSILQNHQMRFQFQLMHIMSFYNTRQSCNIHNLSQSLLSLVIL